jgi:hypothetical protein
MAQDHWGSQQVVPMRRMAEHSSQVLYATKAPRVEVTVESGVFDITVAEHVEFQISGDGSVVWFQTEKKMKVRIGQIEGPMRV